jgi:hypothetical protein
MILLPLLTFFSFNLFLKCLSVHGERSLPDFLPLGLLLLQPLEFLLFLCSLFPPFVDVFLQLLVQLTLLGLLAGLQEVAVSPDRTTMIRNLSQVYG